VQFALKPDSFEYAVIEVNPRVSRSSALASKATGYPIAKVAALIAVGYRLDEIPNAVTHKTAACFEPVLDYVVVKFPKWPFDKFVYAKRTLGTQMKATGEVMAIGTSFEQALMKAVRGAEISVNTLNLPAFAAESDEAVFRRVGECTDQRLFAIFQALKRGMTIGQIHGITKIDRWFLAKLAHLADIEARFAALKAGVIRPASDAGAAENAAPVAGKAANTGNADKAAPTRAAGAKDAADNEGYVPALDAELYREAKDAGYPDAAIETMLGAKIPSGMRLYSSYKMVDTCAGEFSAETPYFYATYDAENEAAAFLAKRA
jgi:carbamoyl-phosphate synthase large subunit